MPIERIWGSDSVRSLACFSDKGGRPSDSQEGGMVPYPGRFCEVGWGGPEIFGGAKFPEMGEFPESESG